MENPKFLKEKYNLQSSPEVESAARRTKKTKGKEMSGQAHEARIQNYLNRLKEIIERKDQDKREQGMRALKKILHNKFVIKSEEIPESFLDSIKRRHREEGHDDIDIPEGLRAELAETLIAEQLDSLDAWIDYLASNDAKYPDWLKYWAIRNILKMGRYDKEKQKFTERTGHAVNPFPEINHEALALIFEAMEAKHSGKSYDFGYDIEEETKKSFLQALDKGNFPKLYALAIEEFNPIAEEFLKITEGQWVKYPKGSDSKKVSDTLRRRGTGWCIAGEPTARRYLLNNDLEIFYSLDSEGNSTIPRVVIVSSGDNVSEVRGVARQENLDPHIGEVVKNKLSGLSGGKSYEKKLNDMKLLTLIENKTKNGQVLTKNDLVFLYEIDSPIQGFGYQRDPRIKELREQRDPQADMLVVLDCSQDQIAHTASEINQNTRAYLGQLKPGTFDKVQQYKIEHVFTTFPEGKIRKFEITIGGKMTKQLERELKEKNINVSSYGQSMLKSEDFTVLSNQENATLVRLKVADLGFANGATTDEIYRKAQELGLELCPAEVGPNLRLQYLDQPLGEYFWIAMKQIAGRGGYPLVFELVRYEDGLWLYGSWVSPGSRWVPDDEFVFRLRKLDT